MMIDVRRPLPDNVLRALRKFREDMIINGVVTLDLTDMDSMQQTLLDYEINPYYATCRIDNSHGCCYATYCDAAHATVADYII